MDNNKRVKYACYTVNISMAIVGNLSPLLFITLQGLYDISYTLLGLLVLINFSTQLLVDLIFSFFSHRFNIPAAVKATPILTIIGLLVYALFPFAFENHVYVGLVIGTIIFSAASGFSEVLISPVIAALPAKNPEREMSKLHSIYAWGVVGVVLFATVFLLVFGKESWQWLSLILIIIPLLSALLFFSAKLPKLDTPERASGALKFFKNKQLWICFLAIFLGGAAECTMAQWCSGYLEQALGIKKVWGDVFGVAVFSMTLGLGRSLYAKIGKNIGKVLFLGGIGATVCYATAILSPYAVLGLVACALTGFCVSMLWPGSLVVASDRFPTGGVFIY
ncbi:MAG: MFS transporter, partial [Clostridia bacterium]|nr:MFS transporter [Clostridia bacterium]